MSKLKTTGNALLAGFFMALILLVLSVTAHAGNITSSATNYLTCPGTTATVLNYKNSFRACVANYWAGISTSTADPQSYCDGTFQVAVGTSMGATDIATWQTVNCNGSKTYTIAGTMVSGTNYYVSKYEEGSFEYTGAFSLETTNPNISSSEPASQWYNSDPGSTINVTFTDNAAVCTAIYQVWSAAGKTGTNYVSLTTIASNIDSTSYNINGVLATPWASMGEGNNYFTFRALDCAGNARNSNDTFNMMKDTVNPSAGTVTPASTDSGSFVDATFNLSTTFTDATSGVASCQYCKSTDGTCNTEWAAATWSAGTCSQSSLTCTDGQSLKLNMRATDNAGNTGAATAVTRTCDNAVPTAGAVTPANTDDGTYVDGTFDFSTTFGDGTGSGVASCEYCSSSDGTCDTEWTAATWGAGTCSITGVTCTNGQTLKLKMRATDAVGNVGASAAITRICDAANPTAGTITPANNDDGSYVDGTFNMSATFADAASGVASCEYCKATDGSCDTEWAAATWGAGSCSVTGITCTDGDSLTLNMRATDNVGNVGAGSAVTRTCDNAGAVAGTVTPASNDNGSFVDATFNVSTSFADAGSGVASCEYCKTTDGTCDTEWTAGTWGAGSCSVTGLTCTDGDSLTLNMRTTDSVGNVGTGTEVTRTCDDATPIPAAVTPANTDDGTYVDGTFDFSTAFDDGTGSGVASCEYCSSSDGTCNTEWTAATWAAGTCSITGVTCTDGQTLKLKMRATDEVGNLGTSAAITRICDAANPTAGAITPANNDDGSYVDATFDVSATFADAAAGVASCEYCKSTDGTCDTEWAAATWGAGSCSVTGITCSDGDSLTLNMRATDNVGNVGAGAEVTRTCDDAGPTAATVTPANTDDGSFVDATFDLSTAFGDGTGSGVVSCEYCKTTDGTCDTEWAAASWGAGSCSTTNITCSDGDSLTLNMRATDNMGNLGTGTPVTRTCDDATPIPAAVTPANNDDGTYVDATFDVSTSFGDGTGSGVASCEYCKATDGTCDTEWAAASWGAGSCSITNITCSDGDSLTLNMRATDNMGNLGTGTPVTRTCDDATPIPATVTPANTDDGTYVDATFDMSTGFGDGTGSGVVSCEYCKTTDSTCDTEWAAATWGAGSCSTTNITCSDGDSLTLNMRATDNMGNLGTGTPVTRTCDDAAPSAAVITPANTDDGTYVDATFNVSATFTDAASGVASCEYCKTTDGTCDTEWAAATWGAGSCSITNITCSDGDNLTLNMRATDNMGNLGTGSAVTRTCDDTVPSAGAVTPANNDDGTLVDGTFDFSATFSDAASGVASCEYCKATDGSCDTEWAAAAWGAGTCSITNVTCTDGDSLTLNMRATDATDNVGAAASVSRTCDDQAPTITATSISDTEPDGYLNSITYTFSETLYGSGEIGDWTLTDKDGSTDLLNTLIDGNVSVVSNTVTITLNDNTGTTGAPTYTYTQAGGDNLRDSVGNPVANIGATVSADTAAPVFMYSSSNKQVTDSNMPSGTVITITFSEDVVVNGAQVTAADWSVTNGGWHGGASVTYADGAGNAMTATLSSDTTSNDWQTSPLPTMDRSAGALANANSIEDSSGNDAVANAGADVPIIGAVDNTPPSDILTVYDGPNTGVDLTFATSSTTLKANWAASADPETGISRYWYAVGTASGTTDVRTWTTNLTSTSLTATGLSLIDGTTYYITVKAENGGALQSNPRSSNGQFVDASPPVFTIDAITPGAGSGCQYVTGTTAVYYNNNTSCNGGAGDFTITTSASDAHSGITSVEFPTTVSAGISDTVSPYSIVYSYTNTSTFSASATVTAYNSVILSTDNVIGVIRDVTAPVTTDNWTDSWTFSASVTFTLTPTDSSGSGIQNTLYCVDTNNTCSPSTSGTSTTLTCPNDTVCVRYVRYYSIDNVNNIESVKSDRVRQDRKIPIAGTISPANSDSGTHVDATFDMSTPFTSNGSYITSCDYCRALDGSCDTEWASATFSAPGTVSGVCSISGITCTDAATLSLKMRAVNAVGNLGYSDEISRICDDTVTVTTDNWDDANWSPLSPITVTLTPADTGGSGVQDTFYCIDTANTCTPSATGTAPQVTCANGSYCTQYLRYFSRDNVDKDEAVLSQRVRQDLKMPSCDLTTPTQSSIIDGAEGPTSITGYALDENFLEYAIYYGPGANPASWGTIVATSTTAFSSGEFSSWDTSDKYGVYTILLRVKDQAGNVMDDTRTVSLFTSFTASGTLTNDRWTMISIPGIPLDSDPKSFLGDSRYEVQRWDSYGDVNDPDNAGLKYFINFSVTAGDAFWVKPYRGDISFSMKAWVADTTQDYVITLQEGWNQVGVPYNREIAWSSLTFKRDGDSSAVALADAIANGWINSVFYSYSVNDYAANDIAGNMTPGEGYFVLANEAGTLYIDPGAGMSEGLARIVRPVYDWRLKISAETDEVKDSDNFVGVQRGGSDGFGVEDSAEPPIVEPYVSVYFQHDDWGRNSGKYASDIRGPATELETEREWPFVVETSEPGEQVVLSWPDASAIPDNYVIQVRDEETGVVIDPKSGSGYTIVTNGEGKRNFTVLARKTGDAEVEIEEVTRVFKAGWNLFSVPVEPEATDVREQLGEALKSVDVYQFYAGNFYDPQSEEKVDIQAGIGYWMYAPEDMELEFTGTEVREDEAVVVPLEEGWNLIGNPFSGDLVFGDNILVEKDGEKLTLSEAVDRGWIKGRLFSYQGETGGYLPFERGSVLEPWTGYAIWSNSGCDLYIAR